MGMKYPQEFLWFVSSFLCPAGAVEGDGAEPFGVSDNVAECPRMQGVSALPVTFPSQRPQIAKTVC